MADEVILYDLREKKYPGKVGDTFRTVQIFQCFVCGALTNKVHIGRYPGPQKWQECPHNKKCRYWHYVIEKKMRLLAEPYYPHSFKEELRQEIQALKEEHKNCYENDIQGAPCASLEVFNKIYPRPY